MSIVEIGAPSTAPEIAPMPTTVKKVYTASPSSVRNAISAQKNANHRTDKDGGREDLAAKSRADTERRGGNLGNGEDQQARSFSLDAIKLLQQNFSNFGWADRYQILCQHSSSVF